MTPPTTTPAGTFSRRASRSTHVSRRFLYTAYQPPVVDVCADVAPDDDDDDDAADALVDEAVEEPPRDDDDADEEDEPDVSFDDADALPLREAEPEEEPDCADTDDDDDDIVRSGAERFGIAGRPFTTPPLFSIPLAARQTDMATRPEHLAPPEIFYGEDEAKKYTGK